MGLSEENGIGNRAPDNLIESIIEALTTFTDMYYQIYLKKSLSL
jgi:hypothetical protein